ncbi:hypothetical protein Tco_0571832 [Tanacetum coccineum]
MASGNEQDAKDTLSKLLQMGTVAEYESEAFSLARATEVRFAEDALSKLLKIEARFEDERSTTSITKTNDINTELPVQDLEETIRHKPNKVKDVKTSMVATSEELEQQEYQDDLNEISKEKDDAKPPISADTFGSNGGNDSKNYRVQQKSLGNWKELDNESKDRKVEMAAKREGEPTILATFGSDRGITIWDPGIKSAF